MSIRKIGKLGLSPTSKRSSAFSFYSSSSIPSSNCYNDDQDNFYFDKNFKKNLFPEWLEKQEDFKKLREAKGNYGVHNIFEIWKKRAVERSDLENGYVLDYLKTRVEYFITTFDAIAMKLCSLKIGAFFLKAGQTLYEKHSKGIEMYIIYNGEVGIYDKGLMLSKVKYNNVIGEKVIEFSQIRENSAVAITDWELLTFSLEDFKNIITQLSVQILQANRTLLSKSPFFEGWELSQRERILHLLELKKIRKGK